jgi:hypothetical protein
MTCYKLEYWIKEAKSQKSQEEQDIKFVELKSLIASETSQEKVSVVSSSVKYPSRRSGIFNHLTKL